MRKALSVIALVLLAVPAFAQDDGGFGGLGGDSVLTGGDIDALLGGGRGNRGNNNNNNDQIPNPENLLLQVKDLLKVKKVPLTKDQEKTLKPFLETETTTMRTDLEAQFGNRGGNRGNNNTATMLQEIFAAVGKHNTELLTAMKADLTPDQAALITKAEKDKKVCTVMLDLVNPQQLQNRNNEGNRGNRGNNNQGFNPPPGFEDLVGFGPENRGGNRGNNNNNNFFQNMPDRAFCTTGASTTAERLAPVSSVLTKGKKPLTPDQEKKFSGLIETALPKMQEELRAANPNMQQLLNDLNRNRNNNQNNQNNNQNQAVNPQTLRNNIVNTIMTQLGIPNNNNNNNNNRGGGRGNQNFNNQNIQNPNQNNQNPNANNANANNQNANNNPSNNNQNNPNNQNFNNNNRGGRGNQNFNPQAEIRKKNEELYDKIAAKLNPDQATVIKKYKYDQIKARRGAELWRGIMEEEGTPLAPEQLTQIQQLFNAQNQLARQYADQLVQAEMTKAPTLEPPPLPANQQQQNRNPNNVAQNPVAQQIIQKVMPEVSKRHAILEKSLEDTILKTLTPPQVASFKLNKL